MKGTKVCKSCRLIFEGESCPECGSSELSENFKGRVVIINPESSEIAKNLKLNKKGNYAIKVG